MSDLVARLRDAASYCGHDPAQFVLIPREPSVCPMCCPNRPAWAMPGVAAISPEGFCVHCSKARDEWVKCEGGTVSDERRTMTTPIERTKPPLEPETAWYDDQGRVVVTLDDRFHGYANRMRELVESLTAWGDPALWQYNLDLLREAIEHEQATVDREWRGVQRDADNEGLADDFNAGAFYGGCNPEPSQGGHGNG